jgi:ADP-ribose pyrophosphatase YjhB (NUDIX family)
MESAVPDGLPVRQVSGFCFDGEGRILLIDDGGQFGLPGGKPEEHERFDETMRREALEEAQVVLGEVRFLGYQRVEGDLGLMDGTPYAQIRAIAQIAEILPSAPDPASGRVYRRFLCPASVVAGMLRWGKAADTQAAAACRLAQQTWALSCSVRADPASAGPSLVEECAAI